LWNYSHGDLIQFDLAGFGIILTMNLLRTYRARVDCEDYKVTFRDEKGETYVFMGKERKNLVP